eukprot:gene7424-8211_t
MSTEVKCYWAPNANEALVPATITRRNPGPHDVSIKIIYAGICHSDIHKVRNDWKDNWGLGIFPMVPGHEIVGVVESVGDKVTKFQEGQRVGVGCLVDSCRHCKSCRFGDEQFCSSGSVLTYGSKQRYPHCVEYNEKGGNVTYGGYSERIIVDENYVLRVPDNLDIRGVAPLLCAGITAYSPLMHFNLRPYHKFAVAGLGGLGHMGVKFGLALGAHTTVLSRGTSKKGSALTDLHADAYVDTKNGDELKSVMGTFDFILNTIAADHDINAYLRLLKHDGIMVMLGIPEKPLAMYNHPLVEGRRLLTGSLFGGIRETQEMLDFCGRKNIVSDVEVISADRINEAYERTLASDVKYRFVIDTATL